MPTITRKKYIDPDGKIQFHKPGIWNNTSPVSDEYLTNHGWTIEVEEIEIQEPQLPEDLVNKERALVQALATYATTYQIDLMSIPDITIPSLLEAARQSGMTETETGNAASVLLALTRDVEAESGKNWSETWQDFKSRLPGYLQELQSGE